MTSCVMLANNVFPYAKSSGSLRIISILSSLAEKDNHDKQGVYTVTAFTPGPVKVLNITLNYGASITLG